MTERHESFSKQMRLATRDIHKISDSLVNAKLAFALSDNKVWADGLLIFYEIFRYLEDHVPNSLLPIEFHRKEAFERDLDYFLGSNWKQEYKIRPSVRKYLNHLHNITENNPILLLAYVYHLYMGLLSGGQILQKKRSLGQKLNPLSSNQQNGIAVTKFATDQSIFDLKQKMRNLVDGKAKELDQETKNKLIEESKMVFQLNNEIVRTVQGVNFVNIKKIVICLLFILTIYLTYFKLM